PPVGARTVLRASTGETAAYYSSGGASPALDGGASASAPEGSASVPKGPPTAATAWDSRVPEPSRRPSSPGSGTGLPVADTARGGACPAQARSRQSSPLRNRCTRTPPVARPLRGTSA